MREISATLSAPTSMQVNETFEVVVEGPNNHRDFVTIVSPDAPDSAYSDYFYSEGPQRILSAPGQPGDYELRYVTGQSNRVLSRFSVVVREGPE